MLKDGTGTFITSLVSIQNLNKNLQGCDPNSLMMCGLKATSLRLPLDPNLGQAYPVPYSTKKKVGEEWVEVKEAQFQIGYKGLVQLAQRTGKYETINVIDIRAGELVSWDELEEKLVWSKIQDENKRMEQPVIGYVGIIKLKSGFKKTVYWTREKVLAHAKRFSKTYNKEADRFASYNKYKKEWTSNPWESDFDSMAKKTVLKDLISKWGPVSIEDIDIQEAIRADQAVLHVDENTGAELPPDYADNPTNTIDAEYTVEGSEPVAGQTDPTDKADEEFKQYQAQKAASNKPAGNQQDVFAEIKEASK
jgi:recombination protein RecT